VVVVVGGVVVVVGGVVVVVGGVVVVVGGVVVVVGGVVVVVVGGVRTLTVKEVVEAGIPPPSGSDKFPFTPKTQLLPGAPITLKVALPPETEPEPMMPEVKPANVAEPGPGGKWVKAVPPLPPLVLASCNTLGSHDNDTE